jgi:hypothetical protein
MPTSAGPGPAPIGTKIQELSSPLEPTEAGGPTVSGDLEGQWDGKGVRKH